jgi:hypothetical protein
MSPNPKMGWKAISSELPACAHDGDAAFGESVITCGLGRSHRASDSRITAHRRNPIGDRAAPRHRRSE